MLKILGHKETYNDGVFEVVALNVEITDERKEGIRNPEVEIQFFTEPKISSAIIMWDMPNDDDSEGKQVNFQFTEEEEDSFIKYITDNKLRKTIE